MHVNSTSIQDGKAIVGGKQVTFRKAVLQQKFRMYVPESFQEDESLSYRYSSLSDKTKSPLGIAVRYARQSPKASKEKMIANFFGGDAPQEKREGAPIHYRESVSESGALSIYLMRFALETRAGVLLGCFNCSGEFMDIWRPAVFAMLDSVEEAEE